MSDVETVDVSLVASAFRDFELALTVARYFTAAAVFSMNEYPTDTFGPFAVL